MSQAPSTGPERQGMNRCGSVTEFPLPRLRSQLRADPPGQALQVRVLRGHARHRGQAAHRGARAPRHPHLPRRRQDVTSARTGQEVTTASWRRARIGRVWAGGQRAQSARSWRTGREQRFPPPPGAASRRPLSTAVFSGRRLKHTPWQRIQKSFIE